MAQGVSQVVSRAPGKARLALPDVAFIRGEWKESENYFNRLYWGYIGRMEKKMETTIMM